MMTVKFATIRGAFDYTDATFGSGVHAQLTVNWLKSRGLDAKVEYSIGQGIRVWVEDIEGYFWPEDRSEERWLNAV